jgi:hypothetical protein
MRNIMNKPFLLITILALVAQPGFAQSSVKQLFSGSPNLVVFEATVDAGDTVLTPVLNLSGQGDIVPTESLIVSATSGAAVAVNVDVHAQGDAGGAFFEILDDEVVLSGASPQVGSSDLDDTEPYVRLEIENAGAAQAVVRCSYLLSDRFAAQETRTPVKATLDQGVSRNKTVTLPATVGTDTTAFLDASGRNRLALFVQPTATGLTYGVDGRAGLAGPLVSIVSGAAVGAADARLEVSLLNWGVTQVSVTVDNPTTGAIDLTYSAATLP